MALSNMFREPRREITETLLGMGAFGAFLVVDYWAALGFYDLTIPINPCPVPLGMVLVPILIALAALVMWWMTLLIHAIGESISDWLGDRGMDPRPKDRY